MSNIYKKDFESWNNKKKDIDSVSRNRQCHDGEVWMISIGINIGNEIDGKGDIFSRPVLVIRRCNRDTFIGVPLTKTDKGLPWYVSCDIDNKNGACNISQIRLFDQKRLLRLVKKIEDEDFNVIKQTIRDIFV